MLLQDRREPRQYFLDDRGRYALQLPSVPGTEVDGLRLVAAYDASCACGALVRAATASSAVRAKLHRWSWAVPRRFRQLVERSRRDHERGALPVRFMTRCRIKRDETHIAAVHHRSSRPTGFPRSHPRSSAVPLILGWHCANSSSSV